MPTEKKQPITSESQRRAVRRYNAANTRTFTLCCNNKTDADIIALLDPIDNKQGFIKALVREYIAAHGTAQKEGEKEMKTINSIWYAVMTDADDTDWGTGSYDKEKALEMALSNADIYPDGYIAVIDESGAEKVCIAEIHSIAPVYTIQAEYLDAWGATDPNDTVSAAEVIRLAREWEKPIEELLGQLVID